VLEPSNQEPEKDATARPLASWTMPSTVIEAYEGNVQLLVGGRLFRGLHTKAATCNDNSQPSSNRSRAHRRTLTTVKTTAARVPSFGDATQSSDTSMTAITAVSLIAHAGMASGATSAWVACQKSRFRYSAKIRLMTAFPPSWDSAA
jgi:hypothetical protein